MKAKERIVPIGDVLPCVDCEPGSPRRTVMFQMEDAKGRPFGLCPRHRQARIEAGEVVR